MSGEHDERPDAVERMKAKMEKWDVAQGIAGSLGETWFRGSPRWNEPTFKPITPTPDSLEAALRAVPMAHECHREDPDLCCWDAPSYAALAAAVREWIRGKIPAGRLPAAAARDDEFARVTSYNDALAAVISALGL